MSRKSEVYFGRRVNNSTPPKKYQPRWLLQFTRNTDDAKLYIFKIITSWLQQRSTLLAFPQIANKLTGREPLLLPWLATSIPGLCVSVLSTNFSKGQVDEEYSKKVTFRFLRRQFIKHYPIVLCCQFENKISSCGTICLPFCLILRLNQSMKSTCMRTVLLAPQKHRGQTGKMFESVLKPNILQKF